MTATLAGIARDLGHTIGALDATLVGLSPQETARWIVRWKPDWVWFVPYEYRRELPLLTTQATVRALQKISSKARVGLANCPKEDHELHLMFDNLDVDAVIFGDSEPTLKSILCDLPEEAKGLLYRHVDGTAIKDERHPEVDWSLLPIPAWSIFEHQKYHPSAHRYKKKPILPIMASRSCPYGCDFCPQSIFNPSQKHATRPVEALKDEIQHLIDDHEIVELEFYDPTFGIKRAETIELCKVLSEFPIQWSCYTRCDLMDQELLKHMADAGCHTILFGVESGDVGILERTQKELDHKDVKSMVRECRVLNIETIASFIIGLPGETHETMYESIQFAINLNPTYAQFHLLRSFFEHESWKTAGTVDRSWNVTSASVNGYAYIPKDLNQRDLQLGMFQAYFRFYLRGSKIKEILSGLSQPDDWKRIGRGIQQISQHLKSL